MQLPNPIQTFFDADQQHGRDALLAAFTLDAVVRDEGNIYHGHEAIGAWWLAAKEAYKHRAEPFEVDSREGTNHVRATVTGNFPGSPAVLTYNFRLEGDLITALEITA